MKAYNLKPSIYKASFGDLLCLQLGEDGRGRKLTLVPCERDFSSNELVSIAETRAGKPHIVAGGTGDGWLARVSTQAAYIRGAYGNVRVLVAGTAKIVASGYGAFGDAGRIGSWDDVLISVSDGAVLRVKPSRGDAYFLHFTDERVVKIKKEELDVYPLEIPSEYDDYAEIS